MAMGLATVVVATACGTAVAPATTPSTSRPSPVNSVQEADSPLGSAAGWIAYQSHGRDFPDHVVVHLVRTDGTEDLRSAPTSSPERFITTLTGRLTAASCSSMSKGNRTSCT